MGIMDILKKPIEYIEKQIGKKYILENNYDIDHKIRLKSQDHLQDAKTKLTNSLSIVMKNRNEQKLNLIQIMTSQINNQQTLISNMAFGLILDNKISQKVLQRKMSDITNSDASILYFTEVINNLASTIYQKALISEDFDDIVPEILDKLQKLEESIRKRQDFAENLSEVKKKKGEL